MEPNALNPTEPSDNRQSNTSVKPKIIIAIVSAIAILSIGFGIYGIVQSTQKENQILSLSGQVSELRAKISFYEENASISNEESQSSGEERNGEEVAPGPGSGRYLEIPEWGAQFEYPDNIIEVTYDLRPKDYTSGPIHTTIYFDCISYYPINIFHNMTGETLTSLNDGVIKYCATEDGVPGVQGAQALGELQRWDEIEIAQYKEKGIIISNLLNVGSGGETIFEQDSVQYNLANPDPSFTAEHRLAWEQLRALLKT